MKNSNLYFPTLDGLRFVAFLLVLFHHVSFYIGDISQNIFWSFLSKNGWVGVDIFFVLTGFLITILFLEERKKTGQFVFKSYFIRRSLRILPLYFLAFTSAFFILPVLLNIVFPQYQVGSLEYRNGSLPWYLTLLGNWYVVFNGFGDSRLISILWAVCLDVQFYIFWPFVLLFLKNFKTSLILGLVIILASTLYRWYLINSGVSYPTLYVNTFARLDTFMFGSIFGFLLFYKGQILEKFKRLYSLPIQIILIGLLILYMYFATQDDRQAIRHSIFGYTVTGILSSCIVLFFTISRSMFVRLLNHQILRYLGRISYGLYIWHILAILIIYYSVPVSMVGIFLPVLALPLTIFLAYISYQFYERPFLNIGLKFKN